MSELWCVAALVLVVLRTSAGLTTNILNVSDPEFAAVDPQYVVSLKQKNYHGEYKHFCSGSILAKEWILTAGHCFADKIYRSVDNFVADVGSEDLLGGTRYRLAEFYVHPNESESIEIFRNDLALLRLKDGIEYDAKVGPVHLGTVNDQSEVPVVTGGWGRVSDSGHISRRMRYLQLTTMNYEKCQALHKPKKNLVDRQTQICCFGGVGRNLCFGDSGSPLISVKTGLQVGVFSSLEDCTGTYPTLFMRVESFIGWINNVTKLDFALD